MLRSDHQADERDVEEYCPNRATVLKHVHNEVEARGSMADRTLYRQLCSYYPG